MKNIQKIHNLIILDESGSMQSIKRQTIAGFNDLTMRILKTQREFPGQTHFITLVTFNSEGITLRKLSQPVSDLLAIDDESFQPTGQTPLFDAICKATLRMKHELYHEEANYNVLVTIITDGAENSSREFSLKETRLLIETMSANPTWAFGLIGANIHVEMVANALSIPLKRTISFTADDTSVAQMFERYGKAQEMLAHILDEGGDCDDLPF